MKTFKFLGKTPIAKTHFGKDIFAEQYFYTMNKEEISRTYLDGRTHTTPKYVIVQRFLPKIYEDKFIPDYNTLWYFKTREDAEFYKSRLIHWDEHIENRS